MPQLIFSPQFRIEADKAWDYLAEYSVTRANAFIIEVSETLDQLAAYPRMGRSREEIMQGMRSFPVGRYLIFYQPIENGIKVLRLKHAAQDIDTFFAK